MDEFAGNTKELKGLFKIPTETNFEANLHQQICNTAKNQFESTGGEYYLHGLVFAGDEQIGNWISRTNGSYRKLFISTTKQCWCILLFMSSGKKRKFETTSWIF